MLEPLLSNHRVVVCVGSGGVGKTTVSASLALAAATLGRKVLVLTIDPARRLANSLGLSTLGNVETRITPEQLGAVGLDVKGELWAMTLDLRRTWDDVVTRYAPTPHKREQILSNPLYRTLSTEMAGSLEYMAMEKVLELDRAGRYDLVVLDTPPTAHALDFIDAPKRLLDLFSHEGTSWLLGGAMTAGKVGFSLVHLGGSYVLRTLARFTGTELLSSLADFFTAFQGMYDGFKDRAAATKALLSGPASAFVLVTSPRPLTIDEALFFERELRRAGIAVKAGIVNRVHPDPASESGATEAVDIAIAIAHARLPNGAPPHLSDRLATTIADLSTVARRDRQEIDRFRTASHGAFPIFTVPRLDRDVHDLAGLWRVQESLRELP